MENGPPLPAAGTDDVEIVGLSADSREVRPGYLFAALNGRRAKGVDFIPDAVRHGAVAVLAPSAEAPAAPASVRLVTDANPRRRLALMAARFYGRQPSVVAAVTGTNGKTSVAAFTRQIWQSAGHRAASLGTLGLCAEDLQAPLAHTTPDPVTLHRVLADIAKAGIEHVSLEASSHGLDQHRLDGVRVTAAAFLNITRDHYDYHANSEAYFAAKAGLFERVLAEGGTAVLNADAPERARLEATCRARHQRVITFGQAPADIRLRARADDATGQRLEIDAFGRRAEVHTTLPGAFQAHNMLAAAGLAIATGVPVEQAIAALDRLTGVRGRLERVTRHPNGAPVFVDYAHTPDALTTALAALRPYTRGRLAVVFGCGGERDAGKRAQMGAVAAELADRVIVTDDNPRGEDPAAIRHAILAACPDAREFGDRAAAIAAAIAELDPGDVLVIAGKGHEQGQTMGGRVIPFDDAEVARGAVAALKERRS